MTKEAPCKPRPTPSRQTHHRRYHWQHQLCRRRPIALPPDTVAWLVAHGSARIIEEEKESRAK
jgi:hypothetical protein